MISLKKQLKRRLLLYMAGVMLVLLLVMNIAMQRLISDYVFTGLQHDAESIISVLHQNAKSQWTVDPSHLSTVYDRVRSGHYYVIKAGNEIIRSRSLFDLDTPDLSLEGDVEFAPASTGSMDGPGKEEWLIYQQLVQKNNQSIVIWVAEDIHPVNKQLLEFSLIIVFIIALLALLQYMAQQNLLNRAFVIFDQLREHVKSVRQQGSIFEMHQVPEEISPLVTEIDRLLEHQHKRIERTRNAISNLAHEIKRPLQILSLNSDALADETQAIDQIKAIIDRELKRAKISGVSHASDFFNAQEDCPFLLEMMQRMYPGVAVEIENFKDLPIIHLDRVDMLELIGNLLDNACKFSQQKVIVMLQVTEKSMLLEIEDDGPGVKSEALEKITQRGFRLDESQAGHGLGLTICADIIDIYQGDLNFFPSDLGGLKVIVTLPLDH